MATKAAERAASEIKAILLGKANVDPIEINVANCKYADLIDRETGLPEVEAENARLRDALETANTILSDIHSRVKGRASFTQSRIVADIEANIGYITAALKVGE